MLDRQWTPGEREDGDWLQLFSLVQPYIIAGVCVTASEENGWRVSGRWLDCKMNNTVGYKLFLETDVRFVVVKRDFTTALHELQVFSYFFQQQLSVTAPDEAFMGAGVVP